MSTKYLHDFERKIQNVWGWENVRTIKSLKQGLHLKKNFVLRYLL